MRRPTRMAPRGPAHVPVHVTVRMAREVWNLRSQRSGKALARAFSGGRERFGFRLIHFAVMGNHVHLLAEATDRVALARGMQGLNIRIARALNRMMGRHGRVLADRYHAHLLRTLTEVRHARHYLLNNARKHYGPKNDAQAPDPYTSTVPVLAPKGHLLRLVC